MKTVAVDLDGTLRRWDDGLPMQGAGHAMTLLAQHAQLVVHTCRPEMAEELLRLPAFSKVQFDIWTGQGKPIAAAYVDDRAVSFRNDWTRCVKEVLWLLEHRPELGNEGRP